MAEFSNRTLAGLKRHKLFRLLLPPFSSFLRQNVDKEIEKDNLVIRTAGKIHEAGHPPSAADFDELLHRTREIDQAFIMQNRTLPISIDIKYQDIGQIREARIRLLLDASYRLLVVWDSRRRFSDAVSCVYDRQQFRKFLIEFLELYIRETRMLSNSIRIPRKLGFARNSLLQTITRDMQAAAAELAEEITVRLYTV